MGSIPVPVPPCGTAACAELNANLAQAAVSRDVIGMAKGILMERHGIDEDAAFDRLVTMSQRTNVKLREIAENLVELRTDTPAHQPEPNAAVE